MSPLYREFRNLASLAAPVAITQLGTMLLLVVDTVMLGHYSPEALSAASLGRTWVMGTVLIGLGALLGMDPLVSQAHGARDRQKMGAALERGMLVAMLISVPIAFAWFWTGDVLRFFGQDPQLTELAQGYAVAQIPGLPFFLGFMVLRGWLQGRRIVRPAVFAVIFANLFNVVANYGLIFGHLGLPELGVTGAGIATTLTQAVTFCAFVALIRVLRLGRGGHGTRLSWRERFAGLPAILRLGTPVALQMGFEMWAFQIATLWAGTLGLIDIASHAIALNLASISFMVPLGISIGASTRIGNLIGAGRHADAQRSAWVALAMGAGVMAIAAIAFVWGRSFLPSLYTHDVQVIALAAAILPIAATFQLFDGVQVVATGVLRGMGRTRPAAVFNFIAYYVLALPIGWWLTFEYGMGLPGIWWGLCIGLALVSIALMVWIAYRGPARVEHRMLPS